MGTAPAPAAQPMAAAELERPQSPWGVPESGSRLHAADRGSPARVPPPPPLLRSGPRHPLPPLGDGGEFSPPQPLRQVRRLRRTGLLPRGPEALKAPKPPRSWLSSLNPFTNYTLQTSASLATARLPGGPAQLTPSTPRLCTAVRSAPAPPGPPTDGFHLCGCPQPGWCGAGIWVGSPLVSPVAPGSREPRGGGGGSRARAWVARISHSVSTRGLGKLSRPVRSLGERR